MKISIDGNIGSGKTFYLKKLEEDGYIVNYDRTDKWFDWFEKYNCGMDRYALGLQLQILYDQLDWPYEPGQLNIYERSPYTLKNIFADFLYEQKIFDHQEYQLHNLYIKKFGWQPDIIIYLYCDHDVCYQRIKNRFSITEDEKSTTDCLEKLHIKHEIVFDDLNCKIPIYKINAVEDPQTIYNSITEILKKLSQSISNEREVRSYRPEVVLGII